MVCPSCAAINPDNLNFCGHCGCGLHPADEAQTVVLDGGAAAAVAMARAPAVALGLITPPPDAGRSTIGGEAPAFTDAVSFAPSASFGSRYRIESLLGEGGMGAVYKAYDTELDRTVALKLVRPELASSRQTMQRFKQELLLASRISHKNILRIHDLGDSGGIKFITMAFVEGADLAALIERDGRLPLDRALKFTRQLCLALEAAHGEGVVHRDLKPQNILIDAADNLYVSDFGLAKSLESDATAMTHTGQILGTPRYMSPEQVEAGETDRRTDLYSLGLILYEMFTGELPFRGDSAMQLMYQRVAERPRDPRAACPDLPEYIARVILKCLEKDPAKRYQNAREILDDLDSRRAPEPQGPAGAQTISIVIPKPKASWVALAAVGGVIAAGLLFAVPAARHWILRAPAASQPAQPRVYMAVIPFNTMGDDSLKYLADGVADALSAKFGGLQEVYVAPGAAVGAAISKLDVQKEPARVAKALAVGYLVQGTAQRAGEQIELTVRLDDVRGKRALLEKEYRGDRRDLLTLEDRMFTDMAKILVIRETEAERARAAKQPTEKFDAYDLYLKGRELLRGKQDAKNIGGALDLFDQAVKRDFGFALAYAGRADASIIMWDQTRDADWAQRALTAAQQAVGLDSDLPEAHLALGTAYTATGRTQEAISELKFALNAAPNSDDALRRLGKAYEAADRKSEAVDAYIRATRVNPYLWRNFNDLGAAYVRFGDYRKAVEVFRKATELQGDNPALWANLGVAYYKQGIWSECIPAFQTAIKLQPKPLYYSNLGVAHFFAANYTEAAGMFAKAAEMNPNSALFRLNLADALRWDPGQKDKAAASYDAAISLALKSLEVNPRDSEALGILAISYAKKGNDRQAANFINDALQIRGDDEDLLYKRGIIHLLAGRRGQALDSLRAAFQHGHSLEEAKGDPELKPLRGTPEYEAIIEQVARKQRQ